MKILTIQEAYELAVKKWKFVVKYDGDDSKANDEYPEFRTFLNNCSYCELFASYYTGCEGCPLTPNSYPNKLGCRTSGHPYGIFSMSRSKKDAQAVLDLIIKTKPEGVEP